MMVQLNSFAVLCIFAYCCTCLALNLPDYVPKCKEARNKIEADELSFCFMDHSNKSREFMRNTGIPEFGLPSVKYVEIPRLEVEQISRAFAYKIAFINVGVRNLDQYVLKNVRYHHHNNTFNGYVYLENIALNGTYELQGRIFEQNLTQSGNMEANIRNVYLWVQFNFKTYVKDGIKYGKLLDFSTDIKVGDVQGKVDDLFGDNRVLNKATNELISQSAKQILDSAKPEVVNIIHKLMSTIARVLLGKVPYYSLFEERKD